MHFVFLIKINCQKLIKRDVFISYSRKNYDTVMEIKRQIYTTIDFDRWE
ncbi:MAG: hypothetical protein K6F85_03680 [Bacteroidales bacterium]|nr:hypothetical protein [Bacteroidales bacterium]